MNFYQTFLVHSQEFNNPGRVSAMDHLEPETRAAVQAILDESKAQGMPLLVFETYRSKARQEELFKQGATQLEDVGVHHWGLAADIVKSINGEPSWKGDFGFLAVLARKHGLISGLDWGFPGVKHGFVDACHVQRVSVRMQPDLFDGTFYPDATYNPYKPVFV